MVGMFECAESFNQDLSGWDVSNVVAARDMFEKCPCPKEKQPETKE